MEIGSIYEVNPVLAQAGDTDGSTGEKLSLAETRKYGKKYCVYTASCREAVALALKSLEQHRESISKRCLLPAYMCDSVFIPFKRAGWELYFYHIDKRLAVSAQELYRLIGEVRPGLLFVHPYYGVDTWKPIRPLLQEWKAQGICIMEDVTQSYYLEGAGAEADYVVGSIRKWYPVPDGGFVASEERLSDEGLEKPAAYVRMRLEALEGKWQYLYGEGKPEEKQDVKLKFLQKNRQAEEELDRYSGIRRLSGTAMHILKGEDEEEAKTRRIANYKYLYERLCGKTQFAPAIRLGEEGADTEAGKVCGQGDVRIAPLYFAIYAREREMLQGYLRERGIFAPVLWPVGKENRDCLSGDETYIYEHMLALPMDQRYGMEEMRFMAEVMEEYERQKTLGEAGRGNIRQTVEVPREEGRGNTRQAVEVPGEERKGNNGQTAEVPGEEVKSNTKQTAGVPREKGKSNIRQTAEVLGVEENCNVRQVIGIRTDANETVATGHVMRCITIAKQLKRKGSQVVFFTADEYGREWLEQAGMDMICLHSEWNHMENEIPQLRKALKKAGCTKLLVDSYQVSADYFGKLRDLCKLAYIDDCFDGVYPVDMLVNYNAYHVRFPYEEVYKGRSRLLLGTSFVPLREEFRRMNEGLGQGAAGGERITAKETAEKGTTGREECGEEKVQNIQHVMISSGGGDRYQAIPGILASAAEETGLQNVVFDTVVGKFHSRKEQLEQLAAEHPNIRLHEEVRDMAELMAACSVAVSAAGTMLFELSAVGIPTVFFVSADNQQYDSEFFATEDRMLFAGDIREDRPGCIREICNGLKKILGDAKLQERMRLALRRVTDGRGAERIARELLEL